MIPPSIGFVVFGVVGGVSITKLFLAGIVPGILIGLGLAFAWWWEVRKEHIVSPPKKSGREIGAALIEGFWALMLPFIIIFGLKFGVFTPTEAGVVAAVYSLIVAVFIYRELKFSELFGVFVTAAKTTAVVMFLVAAALVSSWLITVSEVATTIVDLLKPFMGNQTLLLVAIMVLVVIVGTAMDMTPTILILTPILMPIIKAAGIDPVYFGVLFIVNNSIGLITPPVGTVLNVVAGVSKISMEDLIKGVWPFLLARARRARPDGHLPGARHGAGEMVRRLTPNRDVQPTGNQERSHAQGRQASRHRAAAGRHAPRRRRRCGRPGPDADAALPFGQQQGPPAGRRRREVRRDRRAEERRQDHGASRSPAARSGPTCRSSRRCRAGRSTST